MSLMLRFILGLGGLFSAMVLNAQTPEMRALWVDAWGPGFLTPTQTTQLIADARRYNFNAVFVQMRRRGDAFYMPQAPNLEPRTTAISASYDALADLIAKAHSGTPRIEVHCWALANLIWSGANPPSQPGHVYNRHPEFLMKSRAGATHIGEGYYLDPGHPGAMQWNHNMALDIVRRYNIDGFHWDYIRYPQQDSGYNAVALQRYKTEFNKSITPLPGDQLFTAWRQRQVTDFLRWVSADMLEVKPGLVISAAVFANRNDAFMNRFQDWSAWNAEGLLDVTIPMNYSSDNNVFNTRVNDAVQHQGVRRIYMGQGAYMNSKENTVSQLNYVRSKNLLGTLFYSYRTPNSGTVNKTDTFSYLTANYQTTWAPVPSLPWKVNPTKGIAKGRVTERDTGRTLYNAVVTLYTPSRKTQPSDARGNYGFFEVPDGSYGITATASGLGVATNTVRVIAGRVTNLDLSIPPVRPPEGPVQIVSVRRTDRNTIQLEVQGNAGVTYALMASPDSLSWQEVNTTTANTANFSMEDPNPSASSRMYYIRRKGP